MFLFVRVFHTVGSFNRSRLNATYGQIRVRLPVRLVPTRGMVLGNVRPTLFSRSLIFPQPRSARSPLRIGVTVASAHGVDVPLRVVRPIHVGLTKGRTGSRLVFEDFNGRVYRFLEGVNACPNRRLVSLNVTRGSYPHVVFVVRIRCFFRKI